MLAEPRCGLSSELGSWGTAREVCASANLKYDHPHLEEVILSDSPDCQGCERLQASQRGSGNKPRLVLGFSSLRKGVGVGAGAYEAPAWRQAPQKHEGNGTYALIGRGRANTCERLAP